MKGGIKQNFFFKFAVLVLCAVVLLVFVNTAPPEGLEVVGWRMLGIVIVTLILFISEVLPMVCTCFLLIVMMAMCGIDPLSNLCKNACTSTLFFVMAGFGLGGALRNTNISAIIFRALWRMTKGNSKKLIGAVLLLSAIVSVFIADSAAQVVTVAIVSAVIGALGDPEPGTSRLCGGIMLSVYVGAMTGGLALPISNPVNLAIMEMSAEVGGKSVTFVQWALFGVPVAIILTALAYFAIPKYFKPEALDAKQIEAIEQKFAAIPKKLQFKDYYFLCIMGIMIVLMIASNWISVLPDTAIIAIMAMLLMMLPFSKVQLLNAKGYKENFNVMVPVVMLCLFPLAKAMQASGLGQWFVDSLFAGSASWSVLTVFIVASVATWIIHYLIPSGTATGTLVIGILGPIMVAAGIPIAAVCFCLAVQASVMFILPLEGACQHTFSRGYYTFNHFMGGTSVMAVGLFVCSAFITPLLSMLFGGLL